MEFIICFFVGAIISFIGSIQPGPVNMAVVHHALQKRYRTGLFVAIGGSLPELFYSIVALKLNSLIAGYLLILHQFTIVFNVLLILFGSLLVFRKHATINEVTFSTTQGFLSGLLLALLNPQLLIFWLAVISGLTIYNFEIDTFYQQSIFALGACLGAFALHLLVLLSIKKFQDQEWIHWLRRNGTQILGIALLAIGVLNTLYTILQFYTQINSNE